MRIVRMVLAGLVMWLTGSTCIPAVDGAADCFGACARDAAGCAAALESAIDDAAACIDGVDQCITVCGNDTECNRGCGYALNDCVRDALEAVDGGVQCMPDAMRCVEVCVDAIQEEL